MAIITADHNDDDGSWQRKIRKTQAKKFVSFILYLIQISIIKIENFKDK